MTPRNRILSVYRDETPDVVPFMLDLSHWFYHRHRMPWDLSRSYDEPEYDLIDYHERIGAGFYLPNLGSFFAVHYPPDVKAAVSRSADGRDITWRFETPLGSIERMRRWEETTYAWGIPSWGRRTEADLRILAYALGNRTFMPLWDRYDAWTHCVGDNGVVYLPFGYSAMGQLLNYWLGIEGTVFAVADWPETVREVVDRINDNNLACIDLLATSPAEVILMGDNFSSDIQPPGFFDRWSRPFYAEAIRRLHAAGKHVAVHIDGRLRGAIRMIRDAGADSADAVTPSPMGDLTPAECRDEAGDDFVLSGGVSPDLWLSNVSTERFKKAVMDWLDLRLRGPRLIAAAGDQVPPGAPEDRIEIMRDLVEKHGRY
jgi:hypothetical protein